LLHFSNISSGEIAYLYIDGAEGCIFAPTTPTQVTFGEANLPKSGAIPKSEQNTPNVLSLGKASHPAETNTDPTKLAFGALNLTFAANAINPFASGPAALGNNPFSGGTVIVRRGRKKMRMDFE
jgi:hypothetical protein